MIQIIRSKDRYHFETDWLSTNWHFSFDHYHDSNNMNFGPLRVFNDDTVAPSGGFPQHGHREMEIITYIIDGALEHKDNLGNTGVIHPGEIQRMSAGTGVRHSEFNPSEKVPVHFIQLWITPAIQHLRPSWEQKSFSLSDRNGKLLPIAVPAHNRNAAETTVQIHQDATIYSSLLAPDQSVTHKLGQGRRAYIFVIKGTLKLNDETLAAGDQARVSREHELQFAAVPVQEATEADFLLLDLP
jgi:redox-sensitive bicupin YhaK (pirin superfamily)